VVERRFVTLDEVRRKVRIFVTNSVLSLLKLVLYVRIQDQYPRSEVRIQRQIVDSLSSSPYNISNDDFVDSDGWSSNDFRKGDERPALLLSWILRIVATSRLELLVCGELLLIMKA
jgi:hypothetical protein